MPGPDAVAVRDQLDGEHVLIVVEALAKALGSIMLASLADSYSDDLGKGAGFAEQGLSEPASSITHGRRAELTFDDHGHAVALADDDVRSGVAADQGMGAFGGGVPVAAGVIEPSGDDGIGVVLMEPADGELGHGGRPSVVASR